MEVNEIKQGKTVDIEMKMAQDRALKSSKMYKLIKCDNDSLMPIMGHFSIPDSLYCVYTLDSFL